MARARVAQAEWFALSLRARLHALRSLRRVIARRRAEIVRVLCEETGKPPLDALGGDILVTLEQMRFYDHNASRILAPIRIGRPALFYAGTEFREHYEPHGVALIYAPFNYPFQLAMIPAITALYAGNAVLLKCSEKTPATARLIASLFTEAGFPADLVQVIHDDPQAAGAYIEAHPDIIFFTGSSRNGREVATRAAQHLIPAVLELGGKDAALVFADCNLDRTLEGIVYGAFAHAGQVCVGTKLLCIERSFYPTFIQKLVERVSRLRIGTTLDSDLGVLAAGPSRILLLEQIEEALARGATLAYPPRKPIDGELPIILTDVSPDSRLLTEETFGPILCVAPFDNEQHAIALANQSGFALSASVWTSDLSRGRRIAAALTAGTCAINDVIRNIANPYAAFGGNRDSGYGRYHGPQGLYAFSRIKSVMSSPGRTKREMNWFPFTPQTFTRLNALIALRHNLSEWRSALRHLFLPLLLLACAAPALPAKDADQPHLRVTVTAPAGSHGDIRYLLFNAPDGFPNNKSHAFRSGSQPLSGSSSTVTIDIGPLPPGRYAFTAYQDVNGNGKLDSGFLGIPREPVGVSNNPKPRYGPPRFEDSAFDLPQAGQSISINLVNPK